MGAGLAAGFKVGGNGTWATTLDAASVTALVTVLTTFATLRVALPAVELAVELALRAVEAALRMVEPALRAVEVALRTVLRVAVRAPRAARFAGRFRADARLAVALRRVVVRRFVAARAAGFRAVLPRAGRRFAVRDAVRARAAVVRFAFLGALLRTALLLEAGFLLRLDTVLAMSFPPEVARIREPVAAKAPAPQIASVTVACQRTIRFFLAHQVMAGGNRAQGSHASAVEICLSGVMPEGGKPGRSRARKQAPRRHPGKAALLGAQAGAI